MLKDTGAKPHNIVVCSGKGGTGKTTFALCLASTLAMSREFALPVKLIDCDVEEPNCHLFIKTDYLIPSVVNTIKPQFDKNKCTGCGICSKKCRYNAIVMVKDEPLVFSDMCHSCGLCELICSEKAISYASEPIGKVYSSDNFNSFDFSFGTLNVGAVQTPSIIEKLQSSALTKGINIYDSPPGTACNALKTMSIADRLILVTEPTPFGANDLSLALNLAAHLQIPSSVVINKADNKNSLIETICQNHQVPVVGKIPFRREYAVTSSNGIILTKEHKELQETVLASFADSLEVSKIPLLIETKQGNQDMHITDRELVKPETNSDYNELTVISGKGGTGKTSVTAAFMAMNNKESIAADCDVDAANLHLMFKGTQVALETVKLTNKAFINQNECVKCGKCFDLCRFKAIEHSTSDEKYRINDNLCEGCGLCVEICPTNAIKEHKVETGCLMVSQQNDNLLVHSRLATGGENSGRLVSIVRELTCSVASDKNAKLIIVDGPPGIACPAIASLNGTDRAIIVTEPTLSAFHDLKRVINLTKHFGVITGIIVNKSDINEAISNEIIEFSQESDCVFLGKIPFDETVNDAVKEGIAVTDFNDGKASKALNNIWKTIKETF